MQPRIQTFKPRRGRYSRAQLSAIASSDLLLPMTGIVPLSRHFQNLPVILDIGFGMGDATLRQAQQHPDAGILAIDVHTPGVGKLLAELESQGITNVRVVEGDALALLHDELPNASLIGIRTYFPDPWPKTRHHKRRIVSPANLDAFAAKLQPGGFLHFATDWQHYADAARDLLSAHPGFDLQPDDVVLPYASRDSRPLTKFESRGRAAGRPITDLIAVRTT